MSYLGPSLRRTRAPERPVRRLAVAVWVAIAAHALVLLALARAGFGEIPAPRKIQAVALAPLTAGQWAANRAIQGERGPAPKPTADTPLPTPPDERRPKGQFVDLDAGPDVKSEAKPNDDARFDADRDRHVEKETVSRFSGKERWAKSLPAPSTGSKAQPSPPPGEAGRDPTTAEGKAGQLARRSAGAGARLELPPQQPQERVALAPAAPGDVQIPSRRPRQGIDGGAPGLSIPGQGGGARKQGAPDSRLMPTAETYAALEGGPRDYGIKDIEEGGVTALSTRRFKFATYYSQLYSSIAGVWNPVVVFRARDPEGTMFGGRDYITHVDIVLDDQGRLKDLKLVGSSGLEFLDREAMRAVREAAPFPNPPRDLVDERREIRLGTWAFVFEAGTRGAAHRERPGGW